MSVHTETPPGQVHGDSAPSRSPATAATAQVRAILQDLARVAPAPGKGLVARKERAPRRLHAVRPSRTRGSDAIS